MVLGANVVAVLSNLAIGAPFADRYNGMQIFDRHAGRRRMGM